MTIRALGDLVVYLGAVAAALAAIGVVVRWAVVRPLKKWVAEQVGMVRESTAAVQETADKVHAEVSPNHGQSLKDTVNRTESKIDMLTQRFDDHLRNHPGG
ncbi:hypothetical protein ACFQ08_04010 [Streptosporangium algeriense]|uniref:DUF2746 domain-containing protein n=1 Tax=Streptosporangium algeriense TaxID=1682748 RepID=A0ABW3DIL4_9ACTN